MSENIWKKAAGYSIVLAIAAISYFAAQTAVDSHKAELPVKEYFECLNKFQSYDWNKFQGERPPAGRTCEVLTGYRA